MLAYSRLLIPDLYNYDAVFTVMRLFVCLHFIVAVGHYKGENLIHVLVPITVLSRLFWVSFSNQDVFYYLHESLFA